LIAALVGLCLAGDVQNGNFNGVPGAIPPNWAFNSYNGGTTVASLFFVPTCTTGNPLNCGLETHNFDVVAAGPSNISPAGRISTGPSTGTSSQWKGSNIYQTGVTVCRGSTLSANIATSSTIQLKGTQFELVWGATPTTLSPFIGSAVTLTDPSATLAGGVVRGSLSATTDATFTPGTSYTVGVRVSRKIIANALVREWIDNFAVSKPTFTVTPPANVDESTDGGVCSRSVTFAATANDNCGTPTFTYTLDGNTITSPHTFPVGGPYIVYVTATNPALQTDTSSFTVTIRDTEKPVVTCPTSCIDQAAVECAGSTLDATLFSYTDNCPGDTGLPLTSTEQFRYDHAWHSRAQFVAHQFDLGYHRIKYEVTDAAGNKADCSSKAYVRLCCPAHGGGARREL
jgi:hypothetical protein